MNCKTLILLASTSVVINNFNAAHAAPAPLSCEMQMLINGLVAMERDRGISRQANSLNTSLADDLTKREVKEILDRVYIHRKNSTPDQIKDSVYKSCQNAR